MLNQAVEPKVDPIVIIGEPVDGYREAAVIIGDPPRCVKVINLDWTEVEDLNQIHNYTVGVARNPDGFETAVLSLILRSPTGGVEKDVLKDKMIRHYGSPSVTRIKALDYFKDLEEDPESDDLIESAIDRAGAYWYMAGFAINLTALPDIWQQTKIGRLLRELAFGKDPIVEIS